MDYIKYLINEIRKQGLRGHVGLICGVLIILCIFPEFAILLTSLGLSSVGVKVRIIILLTALTLFLVCWLFIGRKTIVRGNGFGKIYFAVQTTLESRDNYNQVLKEISRTVVSSGLDDLLTICDISARVKFSEKNKAQDYCTSRGLSLLVWGDTLEANCDGAHAADFKLNFSYSFFAKSCSGIENSIEDFKRTVSMSMKRLNWKILQQQSMDGVVVVANNITEISLMIIGLSLASLPLLENRLKAEKIFSDLKAILDSRTPIDFPDLYKLRKKVWNELYKYRKSIAIKYFFDKNFIDGAIFAKKALEMDEHDPALHLGLSVAEFLAGRLPISEFHAKRAKKLRPGSSLPDINLAFLAGYQGDYVLMLKYLKKVSCVDETNIVDVISFTFRELDNGVCPLCLRFYLGWIQTRFADRDVGLQDLKHFLDEVTRSGCGHDVLCVEAKRLLTVCDLK